MKFSHFFLTAAILFVVVGSHSRAADLSFKGNFENINEVQLFNFTVGTESNVTLRTWGYAGGTNAAGETIASGGFDPILSLFNSGGGFLRDNDDGVGVGVDPNSGFASDSLINITLPTGSYILALSQFSNFSSTGGNLADGFSGLGLSEFGGRTTAWAVDILNVAPATPPTGVPDSGSVTGLMVLALGALVIVRRRQIASKRG